MGRLTVDLEHLPTHLVSVRVRVRAGGRVRVRVRVRVTGRVRVRSFEHLPTHLGCRLHLAQVEGTHLVNEGLRARAIEIEGGGRDEVGAQLARRPIQLPVLVGTQRHLVRGTGRGRGRSRGRARL